MNWLIVILTILVLSIVIFVLGGAIGGVFLLVVLNGLSESDAMPVIGGYACLLSLINIFATSLVGWVVAKIKPTPPVPLWVIGLISLIITVALAICTPFTVPFMAKVIF